MRWGHVAQRALTPYHVRNAATRVYAFAPRVSRETFARRGVGQVLNLSEVSSPGAALYRHAFGTNGEVNTPQEPYLNGNGTVTGPSPNPGEVAAAGALGLGLSVGVIAAIVAIGVAINYQIGKAMAPNAQVEGKWAWGNAIGGTVFPPTTLILAVYKNYFRD